MNSHPAATRPTAAVASLILSLCAFTAAAADAPTSAAAAGPRYPRIGNCYHAQLGYARWEEGKEYWSKLGLIIGGSLDLHYDWDHPRWEKAAKRCEENIAQLRKINPSVLILPYVDVIEGVDNPATPQAWWDLNKEGKRWSGWPGYFRINMKLPEVLQYNVDQARTRVLAHDCFDGVFYDCWGPDPVLCPRTAELRNGKAVVMVNPWNLPREGYENLNGALAEDEFNRVIEGKVAFEDLLDRYLRWCRLSRKPAVTMLVGHPGNVDMDEWRWAKVPWKEREKAREALKDSDPQTMRFGLCLTLMGDGYFGYDTGNMGRGNWWWYPEFDAPVGRPLGDAARRPDGTWQRRFDNALVLVNGSMYDAVVKTDRVYKDFSTGRVSDRFTVPMYDGRILIPSNEPPTAKPDVPPRLTADPPATLRAAKMDGGVTVVQTNGGLELRFAKHGEPTSILWHGQPALHGGWPRATATPNLAFQPEPQGTPEVTADDKQVTLTFRGALVRDAQRVQYVETCQVRADDRVTLHFAFEAKSDLDVRLWRHYFAFPVAQFANATARAGDSTVRLPEAKAEQDLLKSTKTVAVKSDRLAVEIESSLGMGLIDHRRYGTDEFLLAGYPVHGKVAAGTKWQVDTTLHFSKP